MSSTTKIILFVVLTVIWILNLRVLYKVKNQAAFIIVGMLGMFVLMMVFVRPWATMPLARIVAALAGFVGRITGTFTPFFKYGIFKFKKAYPMPIIVDGKIQFEALKRIKQSYTWLMDQLKDIRVEDIFYAFYKNKKIYVVKSNDLK